MSEAARRDAVWAAVFAAAAAVLLNLTNLVEWWQSTAQAQEHRQVDELLGIGAAMLLAAIWYAWRRVKEARCELRLRNAAEAKLRESIEQFTTVLDYAPVEIYVKDLSGHNVLANRRALTFVAPADGNLKGRTAYDIFPRDEAELYAAQDCAILESGSAAQWEYELLHKGGRRTYFSIKFPIFDGAGKLVQIGAIITDITELKQHEAALRDSEARLRAVIDNTPCGISLKDAEGRYIMINRWYEARLGKSSEQIRGKRSDEIFPRPFAESGMAQDRAVLASGAVLEHEEEWELPDGAHRLFTVKFPIRDSGDRIVAIGSITTDISERKRAEEKDRVNQARLQAILDYSPLALYLTDTQGRLLLVNRRFEEWFGISNAAALGKRASELFGDKDSRIGELQEQEVLRSGTMQQRETTKPLRDGSLRTTMIAKFPVFDGHGGMLGTGSAEVDITELKATQRALQRAKEDADRANAAKSRFLAAASHDLRQPLHALNLLIEALSEEADPAEREAITSAMRQATSSMGEMLNSLLDISQLDAGVIRPELHDFHVGPLLDELARAAAVRAEAKGLDFRVVPSQAVVHSDRALLGRIIENLLSNAIRYTSEGKILLGCRRRGDRLRIEVWDSGVGIQPEHIDKIFEEYYQLGNPARDRSKGLGLGLAIVDRISRILHHPVEVRSDYGKGSLFAVDVPLGTIQEGQVQAGGSDVNGARLSGYSALLIEDDELVVEWTQRLLQNWELTVWSAASASEVQRCIADAGGEINLIIADLRLPGGESGLELIRQARAAIGAPVPAIVTTGDTSPDLPRLCADANCSLLHKPIAPAKLRSLVRWLLSERRIA